MSIKQGKIGHKSIKDVCVHTSNALFNSTFRKSGKLQLIKRAFYLKMISIEHSQNTTDLNTNKVNYRNRAEM